MKKYLSKKETNDSKVLFKKIYKEEFDDSNESFMDFMLDLIPEKKLIKVLMEGSNYYYLNFDKYK